MSSTTAATTAAAATEREAKKGKPGKEEAAVRKEGLTEMRVGIA